MGLGLGLGLRLGLRLGLGLGLGLLGLGLAPNPNPNPNLHAVVQLLGAEKCRLTEGQPPAHLRIGVRVRVRVRARDRVRVRVTSPPQRLAAGRRALPSASSRCHTPRRSTSRSGLLAAFARDGWSSNARRRKKASSGISPASTIARQRSASAHSARAHAPCSRLRFHWASCPLSRFLPSGSCTILRLSSSAYINAWDVGIFGRVQHQPRKLAELGVLSAAPAACGA